MTSTDDIFQDYVQMRGSGLEPRDVLKTLRVFVEALPKPAREALAMQMRQWERDSAEGTAPIHVIAQVSALNSEARWIECPHCSRKNRILEVFCYACGQLLDVGASRTLETHQFADATNMLFTEDYFGEDSVLMFVSRETQERFEVRPQVLRHEVVVGRSATSGGMMPDIDLTRVGAMDLGVSRLHVALRYEAADNTIQVYDLGSANGSYLNGHKLLPKENRVLRSGDELRLGRLVLRVAFTHPGEKL